MKVPILLVPEGSHNYPMVFLCKYLRNIVFIFVQAS